jgi:glucose/arabinose dehydrogenase
MAFCGAAAKSPRARRSTPPRRRPHPWPTRGLPARASRRLWRLFTELNARIRTLVVGPDGAIYLLTDGAKGGIMRVAP